MLSAKPAEENAEVLVLELVELWTKGSFYFKSVLMRQAFVAEELGGNLLSQTLWVPVLGFIIGMTHWQG